MWQIIGQGRAVALLERSLETGMVAHAYLFVGPAHVGKMTLALELAQALNCTAPKAPCGECASCQKIAALKHADIQVVQLEAGTDEGEGAKKSISVEQLDDLQHAANLPPFEGLCRVFIIDGAEFLSSGAANRLLKTLEEPPANVVFILLAASAQLLPETVVSRCQRVEVTPLPANVLEAALSKKWGVNAEKARLLARISHGCLGKAVSLSQDERALRQYEERIDIMVSALRSGNEERFACAAQLAARFSQNREAVHEELDLWLDWWRDVMLVRLSAENMVSNLDRLEELRTMAAGCNLAQIKDSIRSIQEAGKQLRQNANPRLVLEALMLKLPEISKELMK